MKLSKSSMYGPDQYSGMSVWFSGSRNPSWITDEDKTISLLGNVSNIVEIVNEYLGI